MQKILHFLVAFSLFNCSQSSEIFFGDRPLNPSTENSDVQSRTHVFQESMPFLASRADIIKQTPLHPTHVHEVIFAVQQKNMDEIERILNDVSDPSSANYGHHMSGEQVAALTMNPEARDAIVDYLYANGASVTAESMNSEFITASAPISLWNKVFDTEFNLFHQKQVDGKIEQLVRAESFSIPKELDDHVMTVMNTIEMPVVRTRQANIYDAPKEVINGMGRALGSTYSLGWILPKVLRSYYNVTSNRGSALSTQAAYGANSDYFNPSDLAKFQTYDNININQPVMNVNGHSTSNIADLGLDGDWGEGNLDIQYIVAMSPGSPTTYWYWNRTLASWLVSLASVPNVPLVLSISYGADELYTSGSESRIFNAEAIKLGVRGVTILAASGDDGALSDLARGRPSNCAYRPIFPASNPFVVAVGATSGAEVGQPEVVCSSNTTGRITSGGGFSSLYVQPKWQTTAIDKYFATAAAENKMPFPGYNRQGRGFPDISFAGLNYLVMYGGAWSGMAGTSASAPVAAGLFSNINAARMAKGKGSLGWVNPTLYAKAHLFSNDVVKGDNKCPGGDICCPHGFFALKGWDPATGFGSINYGKMQSVFLGLGSVNSGSFTPTAAPTFGQPTSKPTKPTPMPSTKPTLRPTGKPNPPTRIPTRRPTVPPSPGKPSQKPSNRPTRRPIII